MNMISITLEWYLASFRLSDWVKLIANFEIPQLNQFKDAETSLNEALVFNDKDANIFDLLGNVNYKLNNAEKALEYWKKAQSLGLVSSVLDKKIKDGKYFEN